jgi:hypothetical protein
MPLIYVRILDEVNNEYVGELQILFLFLSTKVRGNATNINI